MECFIRTRQVKFADLSFLMWKVEIACNLKEMAGENSFLFSSYVLVYSLHWHKPTLFFPSLYWSGFHLPFAKMWKFLNVQGSKLARKTCLWENEVHVFSGSVSYRYLKLYLFHLEKFWNVCSILAVLHMKGTHGSELVSLPVLSLSN